MIEKKTEEADESLAADALLKVFLRCKRKLGAIAGKIVRPHDIEDIVQETFLRACETSTKTGIRSPRSFMESTVRNLAINFSMRFDNSRATESDDVVVQMPSLDVSLEEQVDSEREFLLFCRAVRELPVQCQRAFLLKKVYGLRRDEIASYLGISESTVQKHITRGFSRIEEYLKDVQPSPAERAAFNQRKRSSRSR